MRTAARAAAAHPASRRRSHYGLSAREVEDMRAAGPELTRHSPPRTMDLMSLPVKLHAHARRGKRPPSRPRGRPTRRGFLQEVAGVALAMPLAVAGGRRASGASGASGDRIALGCIGLGGHGTNWNLPRLLAEEGARVVAVCDVFADRREKARALVDAHYGAADCAAYNDFRRVLDRGDIDAVMISTPDHWHVLMTVLAVRAGKDVICEKPTLTIAEGQALCREVRRHKAVFQTATEDRSIPCYHRMARAVREGAIGKVTRVEVTLPAGQRFPNEDAAPVPAGLDWDLWLGPAPYVPYTPGRTEAQHWRHVWDYSGGKFSDWGMHQLDTVQLALDRERDGPVKVAGRGTVNPGSVYGTFIDYDLTYTYADGVEVHVASGGTGLMFHGTEGRIGNKVWRGPLEAHPAEILDRPLEGGARIPFNERGEHHDFLACVRSRKDPYFPAESGHRCASLLHIGNICMRLGRPLRWDPAAEEFPGDAEANAMRARPMRAPWSLEA